MIAGKNNYFDLCLKIILCAFWVSSLKSFRCVSHVVRLLQTFVGGHSVQISEINEHAPRFSQSLYAKSTDVASMLLMDSKSQTVGVCLG
jgi:hypothetical protein